MPNPTASSPTDLFMAAAVAAAALLAALPGAAAAADASPPIVESPRAVVTLADYEAEMAKLPPASSAMFSSSRVRLVQMLNNLYMNRAVARDARAEGMDRDPVLALQIQIQVDKLLAQARFDKLDRETGAAFDAAPDKYLPRAREVYVTQADRFRAPERVRVSHILVKVGADGDAAAKARAEALRARAAAGTPFADLAREASDDASAKSNGGDIGLVAAKQVDPDFAAAAFALRSPGELSPVVKSAFGYHVIQFHERVPAAVQSFDDAKPEIMAEIRKKLVDDARSAYQETMFKDPAPKTDERLIERINATARAAAPVAEGQPRPKK